MFQRGCVAHQVFYWRNVRQRFWLPIYDMVLGSQWHLETRANYPYLLPEIETNFWSLWLVVTWADLFLVVSFDLIQRRIQGRPPPSLIFRPKWRPKGRKKIFGDRPPPPLIWWSGSATVIKIVRNWNTVQLNTTRITERILSRLSDLYILTLTTNEGQLGRVSQILLTTIYGQLHSAFWLEDNDKTKHI